MPYTRQSLLRAFCLFAAVLCLLTTPQAQTTGRRRLSPREIAQTSFPSVVLIVTADPGGKPLTQGSGFFVRPDIVATNFHVIKGAAQVYVKIVGQAKEYGATTVIGVDRETDLALVRVGGVRARPLPLGAGRRIVAGDAAYALGNPKGFEGTISSGLVSGVRRDGDLRLLQFDAAISPGSSGGPVLDERGEVIGVASLFFREGQNLNFAVHVSHLTDLLNREKNSLSAVAGNTGRTRSLPPAANAKSAPPSLTVAATKDAPAVPQPVAEAAPPPPRPDPKLTYEELLPVLRQTIRARVEGDGAAMSALLADDFSMLIDRFRRLNKGQYLAELTNASDVMLFVLERADLDFDPANNPVLTSVVRYRSGHSRRCALGLLRPRPVVEKPQILQHDSVQQPVIPLHLPQHLAHVALDDDQLAVGHRVQVEHVAEVRVLGRPPGEVILVEHRVAHDLRRPEDVGLEVGDVIAEPLHELAVAAG